MNQFSCKSALFLVSFNLLTKMQFPVKHTGHLKPKSYEHKL